MCWRISRLKAQLKQPPDLAYAKSRAKGQRSYRNRLGLTLWAIGLLSLFGVASAQAQVNTGRWSEPYRLSSDAGKASEGYLVADQFGFVHCFWTETLFATQRTTIEYARFDGVTWSNPNEIYLTGSVRNVSPAVDRQGTLHIVWAEGLNGPAYYSHAPIRDALSIHSWAPPLQIDIPANTLRFQVDSKGVFHILYINRTAESGVYYVRSADQGKTWSDPFWLDPDILPNHIPDSLNFELDGEDGLHAVWFYGALDDSQPDWVRYIHSLDGGDTWSAPFMIDQYTEAGEHNLTAASPKMIVQGHTVHVVWAAGPQPYRNHRFSTDSGQTWSMPHQIFGALQGQAFDGLAVDGAGRLHFFGQIRYPIGIYHAIWDKNQWTPPSLIYLIAQSDFVSEGGDRIHAHFTVPAVRAGEQLVLTFTDPPADTNRRLFVMHQLLDGSVPLSTLPTPAPSATPIPTLILTAEPPTSMPMLTATPVFDSNPPSSGFAPGQDLILWLALIPSLLLLGGALIVWMFYRPKS